MRIYAELHHIDYAKLLSHVQSTKVQQEAEASFLSEITEGFTKLVGKLVLNSWVLE